jgi:hypothetical protein
MVRIVSHVTMGDDNEVRRSRLRGYEIDRKISGRSPLDFLLYRRSNLAEAIFLLFQPIIDRIDRVLGLPANNVAIRKRGGARHTGCDAN